MRTVLCLWKNNSDEKLILTSFVCKNEVDIFHRTRLYLSDMWEQNALAKSELM